MTDPERFQQIDRLLQAALDMEPDKRLAFIKETCAGDQFLLSELESLLSCDEAGLSLIDTPAVEVAADLIADDEPELAAGECIGPYKILSLLGRGGMGEVYLAQDARLKRKIAVKLLPADFTQDQQRVHLFQQEAQAASALNHPNILTIHDITEVDSRHLIAAEYIEGETLRAFMKRAELTLVEKLDIAIQSASGLAAAHQAGIIHRDIKPENLMIRTDGYVKILDFGLAKLTELQATGEDTEASPIEIITARHGSIIGTISYMSPEQAQGGEVDARSDLFSLGVVIYEMIAGRRPFHGSTAKEVIASALEEEPPLLTNHVPDLPDELQSIVSKCLSKNKDERYQTAKELLADLKDLRRRLERQSDLTEDQAAPRILTSFSSIIGESRRQRFRAAMILAGLALVAASLFALFWFTGPGKRAVAFQNITITKLTSNGISREAAISPDGKYVAYVVEEPAQQTIWMKQVATDTAVQLVPPGARRLAALAFSPDGQDLFYARYEKGSPSDTLYRMSVAGGPATRVLAEVHSPVSFSPDGKRFAFFRRYEDRNALLIANTDGTEERELTSRSGPDSLWDYPCGPAWSPDGKVIFCASLRLVKAVFDTTFIAVSVGDGQEQAILAGNWSYVTGFAWLADGSGLLMSGLKGIRPPATLQIWHLSYPMGEVQQVTNDLDEYHGLSITTDSRVMAAGQEYWNETVWVSPGEAPTQARMINSPRSIYYGLSWAPDGRIVYSQISKGGADLWVMNQDGTNREQLTRNSGINGFPSVTPDGKYIIFVSDRSGSSGIWRVDIDGRNPMQLAEVNGFPFPICSADSKWVAFQDIQPSDEQFRWWRIPIDGGNPVQLPGKYIDWHAISPDGKFIAYLYEDAKADPPRGIAIIPFEGGKVLKRFPIPEASSSTAPQVPQLTWSADGQALIYNQTNLWRQSLDGSPPKQLTDFQGDNILFYAWSPDGKQLACVRVAATSDVVLINNNK